MKNISRLVVTLFLLSILSPAAAQPAPDPDGHREERDDPPAEVSIAEQPRAESATVVRGNHTSVQVNVDALGANILGDAANEPSMAIDPTDPNNIVIGWRQFDTIASNFRQAGMAYSHDGGATWTFPGVLEPGQFRSDPVLAADTQGTFYYYSLSTTTNAEMFVSTDKGLNWTGPTSAFGGDKTWIAADTTGGTGSDNVYMIWNSQFTCCPVNTDFSRTTDGGLSYDGPYSMPAKPKWGTVDVGPDGRVHVVGTRLSGTAFPQPHLLLSSSDAQNAGPAPSFEQTTGIVLGGETGVNGTPNPGGLLGQVWVAADRSGTATDGNIYVLGSVNPAGADPMDVTFVRSTNGGASFGSPRRVHGPKSGNAWQWFGTMSVAPDGRIDVIWNDTRSDPSGQISEVYYAYSTDAGDTWSAGLPVTPPFNSVIGHPNQNKIGDYYHMVSENETAALAYSATFNGEQDVWFVRVGDCNANGLHDSDDIAAATSDDCDFNGIADECQDSVVCLGCNDDGVCDRGEDCRSCPADCFGAPGGECGNGVCEPGLGEDCLSCPADCNGVQKGNPGSRFCCGDGDGTNPAGCGDARCTTSGFQCVNGIPPATCCGDRFCEGGEDGTNCATDCTQGTPGEASGIGGPMIVTGYDDVSGTIDVSYTPSCDAAQHTVYAGDLSAVSAYAYDAAACDLGVTGNASFDPGAGDRFFLIVGQDALVEGSYGTGTTGERPEDTGTPVCDRPQDPGTVVCE